MLFDYQMVTFEEIIKIYFFKWIQSIVHLKKSILRKPAIDYQQVTKTKNVSFYFFKWTQSIRFHIRYFLDLLLSMCSYEKVFYKKVSKYHFFAERKDK